MEALRTPPTKRKRARKIAVIEPWCTGCGGAPVCMIYCKKGALIPVADHEAYPFKRMTVDSRLCIGCGACITSGPMETRLGGCPWDAIILKPVGENRDHAGGQYA